MNKEKNAPETVFDLIERMEKTEPVSPCCLSCVYYLPMCEAAIGRQCAAFGTCTTGESCGMWGAR